MSAHPSSQEPDPAGVDGPYPGHDRLRMPARRGAPAPRSVAPSGASPAGDVSRGASLVGRARVAPPEIVVARDDLPASLPMIHVGQPRLARRPRRHRRLRRWLRALPFLIALAAVAATSVATRPMGEAIRPGQVFDVSVRVDGKRVDVPGGGVHAVSLDKYHPLWFEWRLRDSHLPGHELSPSAPATGSKPDRTRAAPAGPSAVALYSNAPATALVAASGAAHHQVTITGTGAEVVYGTRLDGTFPTRGQVVVEAGSRPVDSVSSLMAAAVASGGTTEVRMQGGGTGTLKLLSTSPPRLPFVAVTRGLKAHTSPDISMSIPDGEGSSAGLAMALNAYSWLTQSNLTHGRLVAATGGITEDGAVYPINGARQKAIASQRRGVDLLIVPSFNEKEARAAAGPMRVVGVDTLAEAIAALTADRMHPASGRRHDH